ncbi:response regulator transcription factor [Vibrio metschnikovii]|uniref:response regulator transcription factor n=2 Tax=Vibrio metschnikovii TaxID=28172 RepID=UPI0020C5CB01|nr:response regulator transcription factor [Vibrio metschnikovii]
MMKKILLVDDHPVVNMATKILLERNGYSVVGEATTGIDALKMLKQYQPDLAIIDLHIPQLDGIEVIERSKNLAIDSRFLVLTSQPTIHFANRCLEAGASGFLSKEKDTDILLAAVKSILNGFKFFPDMQLESNVGVEDRNISKLSDREMVVFKYLARGISNKEIAEEMLISSKTVSTYKSRIYEKLNISNIMDVFDLARKLKII